MQLITGNFIQYAMHHYDNPQCKNIPEFEEDLNRIKYIKKLFWRYQRHGELRERLIINHLVIMYNVFGIEAATNMLFDKVEEDMYSPLKTFLLFLNLLPEDMENKLRNYPVYQKIEKMLKENV